MNEDPALYSKSCELQKADADSILDRYFGLLKWQDGDCVMDIGAGEGSVSLEVLLPKLPSNFAELVLLDISEELLQFARDRCDDDRVQFWTMDISATTIPDEFRQHFDHIFSFYCLNWVVAREKTIQAMTNIFDMLKPGGDIALSIMANTPIYDFWEDMAATEEWARVSKNISSLISPYHHHDNPTELLRGFLEHVGFSVHECRIEKRSYIYGDFFDFLNTSLFVSPFFQSLPEDQRGKYIEDYEKQIRNHHEITIVKDLNSKEKVRIIYKILTVYASKPLKINGVCP